MTSELLDSDGENRAVRMFLAYYGGARGVTIGSMRDHLTMAVFPYWPSWLDSEGLKETHLTKSAAQSWIRHLFSLEQGSPT